MREAAAHLEDPGEALEKLDESCGLNILCSREHEVELVVLLMAEGDSFEKKDGRHAALRPLLVDMAKEEVRGGALADARGDHLLCDQRVSPRRYHQKLLDHREETMRLMSADTRWRLMQNQIAALVVILGTRLNASPQNSVQRQVNSAT